MDRYTLILLNHSKGKPTMKRLLTATAIILATSSAPAFAATESTSMTFEFKQVVKCGINVSNSGAKGLLIANKVTPQDVSNALDFTLENNTKSAGDKTNVNFKITNNVMPSSMPTPRYDVFIDKYASFNTSSAVNANQAASSVAGQLGKQLEWNVQQYAQLRVSNWTTSDLNKMKGNEIAQAYLTISVDC